MRKYLLSRPFSTVVVYMTPVHLRAYNREHLQSHRCIPPRPLGATCATLTGISTVRIDGWLMFQRRRFQFLARWILPCSRFVLVCQKREGNGKLHRFPELFSSECCGQLASRMIILDLTDNDTGRDRLGFFNGTEPPMLYLEKPENYPLMILTTLSLSLSAIIGTFGNFLVGGRLEFPSCVKILPAWVPSKAERISI